MILEGHRPLLIVASGGIAIVLAIVLNVVIPRWTDWTSAALHQPEARPQPAPVAVAPVPPSGLPAFDIIRLDRDGNLVVAGRGVPESSIQLFAADELLGEVNVDANGEWVFIPDHALAPGHYLLRLKQRPSSDVATSDTVGDPVAEIALDVPEPMSGTPSGTNTDQATSGIPRGPAIAAPESSTGPTVSSANDITVIRGHSLWRIARKTYGHGGDYTIIFDANRNQIHSPDLIYPGQVLTLP